MSPASSEAMTACERIAGRGNLGGGTGGIQADHRFQAQLADQVAALVQRMDVAVHVREVARGGRRAAPAGDGSPADSARR